MSFRHKIFTAHANSDAPAPEESVEFVPEGFSFMAFLLTIFWLFYQRLWMVSAGYMLVLGCAISAGQYAGLNDVSLGLIQLFVQTLLGFHAYDLQRWTLGRQGYEVAAVVVAETELNAQRRYFDRMA